MAITKSSRGPSPSALLSPSPLPSTCQISTLTAASHHRLHHQHGPVASRNTAARPSSKYTKSRRQPIFHHTHLLLLLIACCLVSTCSATIYIDEQMVPPPIVEVVSVPGSTFPNTRSGPILVDQNFLPRDEAWIDGDHDHERGVLAKREESSGGPTTETGAQESSRSKGPEATKTAAKSKSAETKTAAESKSVETERAAASSTPVASSTTISIVTAPTESASPLPSPLDSGFRANITTGCADFINDFLTNSTFKSCLPFSLLLQASLPPLPSPKPLLTNTLRTPTPSSKPKSPLSA